MLGGGLFSWVRRGPWAWRDTAVRPRPDRARGPIFPERLSGPEWPVAPHADQRRLRALVSRRPRISRVHGDSSISSAGTGPPAPDAQSLHPTGPWPRWRGHSVLPRGDPLGAAAAEPALLPLPVTHVVLPGRRCAGRSVLPGTGRNPTAGDGDRADGRPYSPPTPPALTWVHIAEASHLPTRPHPPSSPPDSLPGRAGTVLRSADLARIVAAARRCPDPPAPPKPSSSAR